MLINAVDINGKFNIQAVSDDVSNNQRVDGSTLYGPFELWFNPVDKTSTLNTKLIMLTYCELLIMMMWLLMSIVNMKLILD